VGEIHAAREGYRRVYGVRKTWKQLKRRGVDGRRFPSYEHAEHETLHWIGFYNEERLHEELGDLPPTEYELINYKTDNSPMVSCR
jgi:transposase InsO family protein